METKNLIAEVKITINASIDKVWDGIVNPSMIKKYMFGTKVVSDWKEGSKIVWKGEWEGKTYEDKGTILQYMPNNKLQYSHFSPLTDLPDIPENYHTVTITLKDEKNQTVVTLKQNKNPSELAKEHSEQNWMKMLEGLKKILE